MPMSYFTESDVEDAALAWRESLGYAVLHDPDIASDEFASEWTLGRCVCQALA